MNKGKRVLILVLSLCLVCSLTGCKSREEKYKEQLSSLIDEVTAMDDDITNTVSGLQQATVNQDEASYQKFLSLLNGYGLQLKEKYEQIAALEAPPSYQTQQEQLKAYSADLIQMLDDSMELYNLVSQAFTRSLTEEEQSRVSSLQEEIMSLTSSADAFDKVLSEILGTEDSSGT